MKHPTDDMLLAYVRQQQRHLWPSDIQEHIILCPLCSGRCAEFKTLGNTLEAWTQASNVDPLYGVVSNRVMRTLYEPKAASREQQSGISRVRVGLPIAIVLVLLCVVLLTGLGAKITGNVAQSHQVVPTPRIVQQQPTAAQSKPTATLGPIEGTATSVPAGPITTETVVQGNGSPTATPTPQHGPSIKVNAPCTTLTDVIENQLHVCGTHFTPGTTVTIYYRSSAMNRKHTTQVGADGTFIDVLYIHSCNDVPDFVYVQSSANPSETAQATKNVTFGTCQGFGKLRKSK